MFETVGLNITILADMHIVNSLDVQFSLNNGFFQPHRISDNIPVYINRKPNHLPVVIKQLQKSIAKHISDISSDETFFSDSISTYSEAHSKSGFNDTFTYTPTTIDYGTSDKEKRKRKVTWLSLLF